MPLIKIIQGNGNFVLHSQPCHALPDFKVKATNALSQMEKATQGPPDAKHCQNELLSEFIFTDRRKKLDKGFLPLAIGDRSKSVENIPIPGRQ